MCCDLRYLAKWFPCNGSDNDIQVSICNASKQLLENSAGSGLKTVHAGNNQMIVITRGIMNVWFCIWPSFSGCPAHHQEKDRQRLDAVMGPLKYQPTVPCCCWYPVVLWEPKGSPAGDLVTVHVLWHELTLLLRTMELNRSNEDEKTAVPLSKVVRHTEFPWVRPAA